VPRGAWDKSRGVFQNDFTLLNFVEGCRSLLVAST